MLEPKFKINDEVVFRKYDPTPVIPTIDIIITRPREERGVIVGVNQTLNLKTKEEKISYMIKLEKSKTTYEVVEKFVNFSQSIDED